MNSKNTFEGYKLKGIEDVPSSDYYNTRIEIKGLYSWGVGFHNQKAYSDFHSVVYGALENAGYTIVKDADKYSCDYLTKEGSHLNLYMHPMEFTGAATREEIEDIVKILNSCECVQEAEIWSATPLYDLSADEYRNMIYNDAENIALTMLNSRYDIKNNYDADIDFAQAVRIDRLDEPSVGGYSSSDIDVSAVNDIRKSCIEMLEKNMSKEEIAKAVGEKAKEWSKEIAVIEKEINKRTPGMTIPELKSFYGYDTMKDEAFKEHYDGYMKRHSLTLTDYKNIANRNGIDYQKSILNEHETTFSEMLGIMEFELNKYHDGYGLVDCQGGNLGNIESDRFVTASDIIDRLDHYINDYYFNDLEEESKGLAPEDEEIYSAEDWVNFMDKNEDFKTEHLHDYKVMKILAESPEETDKAINLDKIITYDYTNGLEITPDSLCYQITAYYDERFAGVESDYITYDWSKAEEIAHEALCRGCNVEIAEEKCGGTIRIKSDDYVKDLTDYDIAEFPYKASDLKEGVSLDYKPIKEQIETER